MTNYALITGPLVWEKTIGLVSCVLMGLQFTSFAILRSHIRNDQCDSVTLMYAEVFKFVISALCLSRNLDDKI